MPRKKTETGFSKQKVGIIGDSFYWGWQNRGLNKMNSKSDKIFFAGNKFRSVFCWTQKNTKQKNKTSEQTDLTPLPLLRSACRIILRF